MEVGIMRRDSAEQRANAVRNWHAVRAWPRLAAESKLCWETIFELTGARVEITTEVNIGTLGERQGAADASRSGRRNLDKLAEAGLIRIIDKAPGGLWTIYLEDPVQVRRARLLPSDPQRQLFEDDSEEEPTVGECGATVAGDNGATLAEIQASVAPYSPAPGNNLLPLTSTSNLSMRARTNSPLRPGPGECGATLAEVSAKLADPPARKEPARKESAEDPQAAGFALGLVVGRVEAAKERQPEEAQRLVMRIQQAVADPNLSMGMVNKIAWEIVQGTYPAHKLDTILRALKLKFGHRSPKDRGSYFVVAMERSFAEHGLDLRQRSPPERRPHGP